jgi:hypothetical protein
MMAGAGGRMKGVIVGFGRFWYDFIVGDDWKIAVAVVSTLALTVLGLLLGLLGTTSATVFGGIALFVVFAVSMTIDVRRTPAGSTQTTQSADQPQ